MLATTLSKQGHPYHVIYTTGANKKLDAMLSNMLSAVRGWNQEDISEFPIWTLARTGIDPLLRDTKHHSNKSCTVWCVARTRSDLDLVIGIFGSHSRTAWLTDLLQHTGRVIEQPDDHHPPPTSHFR